jgi:hypothetical protein
MEFFQYIARERLSSQIMIYDRYHNILLSHDFKIPQKQLLIEKAQSIIDRNSDGFDISRLKME